MTARALMLAFGVATVHNIACGNTSGIEAWTYTAGVGAVTKWSAPATVSGNARQSDFSANGSYAATSDASTTPFIFAYPWSGTTGFGTKYSDPATLPPGACSAVKFSPDSAYLLCGGFSSSPRVHAYPISGSGFGSKLSDPGTVPTGALGNCGLAFAPSGSDVLTAHGTTPFTSAYPWSAGFGSKYSNPGSLPAAATAGCRFTSSGADVGLSHGTTPFVTTYPFSAGFGTKYSDPASGPASTGQDCAFKSTTDFFVAHSSSPRISGWPWTPGSGFGTKYSNPGTLPAGNGQGVQMDTTGVDLGVFCATTPFIATYPFSAGFGTKYTNPGTLPSASSFSSPFN